jgi:putative CocE/NonD family hydrolase
MSDSDAESPAWRITPSAYLATRPAIFAIAPPISLYVTMRDGCRLALDVYLPVGSSKTVPAILILTPYYRRFAGAASEPSPNAGKWRDLFVPRGYALVVVDVRGTGVSFGTRDAFRSPRERDDYREIADWVGAQPWSDGRIGATGISYVGAACDFLASTGHPAVRAIAPISAVWDTWVDHYYPGGLLLTKLAKSYDELMVALDHDRRDLLGQFSYFRDPAYRGPQPVDDDPDMTERDAAVRQHLGNFHMPDFITEFRCRDDTLPYDPGFSSASFSPYHYAEGIPEDVAILSISGWMDGAGYANGSIARFLTLPNRHRHLLLGPWDHGARINVSPWRQTVLPQFSLAGTLLRFFDEYVLVHSTGLAAESPVHYFSLHAERWHEADAWPPVTSKRTFLPDPAMEAIATYQVDFSRGTGDNTRFERLAAVDTRDYYADWAEHERGMLSIISAPLDAPGECTGHAVLTLRFASSEPDAALHVYLSELEADGRLRHVTEGMLRALHRHESPPPDLYRAAWPWHPYTRADAAPLVPGEPVTVRIALLPVSWTFAAGSRLKLSIAGADADHFGQVPHGRPPVLTLWRSGTSLELPWRLAADAGLN